MGTAQENHPTLSLAMIMKDEIDDLERIIKSYGACFDKIYVTVTDKKVYSSLLKKYADGITTVGQIELSYFKWIDHFGKARRYNQRHIKTDYWMWIDTDDEIEGSENIREVVDYMRTNDLDAAWFSYDYIRRVHLSDPEAISRRERIIKTASKLTWMDEAIHEHINVHESTQQQFFSQVTIKHRKTHEQSRASGERNKTILEKDWQRTRRPLTAYYLGTYFGGLGEYEAAIEKLLYAAQESDSDMIRFAAWLNLCMCYIQTSQYQAALAATDKCIAIDPEHPEPWYHKFAAYRATSYHDSAMQAAEIFMSNEAPRGVTTLLNQDTAWHQYKGPLNIAHAYLSLGNTERAFALYSQVKQIAPHHIDEVSAVLGLKLEDAFERAYKNHH